MISRQFHGLDSGVAPGRLSRRLTADEVHDADDLAHMLAERGCYRDLIVVSNREPCVHTLTDGAIACARPAGGLITALEAVVAACGGCWIAHGHGNADRLVCDQDSRVRLPADDPAFTLRRLWLSDAEVAGYYEGFANEGIWPLCHVAHVRPTFRPGDWQYYRQVNQYFADAVVAEAKTSQPVVFVQDYHLALVPQMVRARLPDAIIVTFWHIPWPAQDMLEICPWHRELVAGLAASNVIGFQTERHRANFDLANQCPQDAGSAAIIIKPKQRPGATGSGAYPISIAWPPQRGGSTAAQARATVRARFNLPPTGRIVLGVDRLDYTKGIVERLAGFERFLEMQPELAGQVTLLQIAAPTRSNLDDYRKLEAQVCALATRINDRFGTEAHRPVALQLACHDAATLLECYRACDVCLVTSLHDGMNLVAKEFVAARADERGVLILSEFTGAAQELRQALLVNPYHTQQIADTIETALLMPVMAQAQRMRAMRAVLRRHTVFRWAARLLSDAVATGAEDGIVTLRHASLPIAARDDELSL